MPPSKRKRVASKSQAHKEPRATAPDISRADYSRFHVQTFTVPKHGNKKRRGNGTTKSTRTQAVDDWPPKHAVAYVVKPTADWNQMKVYKTFIR